jgi:uncharacterized membrane protein
VGTTVEAVKKRDWTWSTACILAAVGLLDSLYLSYIKLTNQTASCDLIGDCEKVNNSRYAVIGGVPIAVLGAAGFLLILVLLYLDRPGAGEPETVRFALFGVTLAGTLYSIYLTYLELFVLEAICPFCALSAVVMVGLFVLSLIRLRLWA